MTSAPEEDLRAAGLVRLTFQPGEGDPEATRRRRADVRWLEAMGVRLYECSDPGRGGVWGPEWLNVLDRCFHYRSNTMAIGVSRAAISADWAAAVVSAYALGGVDAVSALLRGEPPE